MHWYERLDEIFRAKGVSYAELGRRMNLSGQNVGQKLRGERGISVEELKFLAREAGLSVAEVVGDDAVVIELADEKDLIELFRLLSPEQQQMLLGLARQFTGKAGGGVG